MAKKGFISLFILSLVALGIVIFVGVLYFQLKSKFTKTQSLSSLNELTQQQKCDKELALGNLNQDLQSLFNNTLEPFYLARIQENEQSSLEYLGGNLGSEEESKYSTRTKIFTSLKQKGWEFISPNFQSCQFIIGVNPNLTENYAVFLVRIKKKNQINQDEIIYVYKYSDKPDFKIIGIDFNPKGHNVLHYNDTPYLVLQTIERKNQTKQKVFLATKDFETSCSSYVQTTCAVFLEIDNKLKSLGEITELNQDSVFAWSNNDNEIIYKKSFVEGLTGLASIESININSGLTKELARLDSVEIEDASKMVKEISEKECSDISYSKNYKRAKKSNYYLEFLECTSKSLANQDSSISNYYLIFNNKVLKKVVLAENQKTNIKDIFAFEVEENIYNSENFEFKFIDSNYILNGKSSALQKN